MSSRSTWISGPAHPLGRKAVPTPASWDPCARVAIRAGRRLFRDAMAACLSAQPEFAVVGHVGTDEDLLRLCKLRRIDLVLYLADEGICAAGDGLGRLRSACPNVRVVLAYDQLEPADLPLT